jgi:hypothetical protein
MKIQKQFMVTVEVPDEIFPSPQDQWMFERQWISHLTEGFIDRLEVCYGTAMRARITVVDGQRTTASGTPL